MKTILASQAKSGKFYYYKNGKVRYLAVESGKHHRFMLDKSREHVEQWGAPVINIIFVDVEKNKTVLFRENEELDEI